MQTDRRVNSGSGNSIEAEESRIKAAYAKRQPDVDNSLYSPFNKGSLFAGQELERRMLALLERYNRRALENEKILEIGCGAGYWLRELIKWGARPGNLAGIDLLADRIAEAKRLCPEAVTLYCGSATKLAFPAGTFDLVLQATVLTSILDLTVREQVALEMLRVLKSDGLILWFDFFMNNPRNPDTRGVRKADILHLFPKCTIELGRINLAPPLTRRIAPFSWLACYLLERIPFLCTHYLGVIRKNPQYCDE